MRARNLIEQFVASAQVVSTKPDLFNLIEAASRDIGFHFFAVIHHADLNDTSAHIVHLQNYPAVWADVFIANRHYLDDPVLDASARANLGFAWHALPKMVRLRPTQRLIFESGQREGLGDGFTVPANIPGEKAGSCSFVTKRGCALPERSLLAAQLIGGFAFEAARRIGNKVQTTVDQRPRLSRRQRECVVLAGQGKSDGVIAQLLGLSEDTVTNYLTAARARCGVATRTQLVTCALFDGEIGFNEILNRQ
jgi:LuxR family transcriptional regulator, quorum-sensing system regulator CciR